MGCTHWFATYWLLGDFPARLDGLDIPPFRGLSSGLTAHGMPESIHRMPSNPAYWDPGVLHKCWRKRLARYLDESGFRNCGGIAAQIASTCCFVPNYSSNLPPKATSSPAKTDPRAESPLNEPSVLRQRRFRMSACAEQTIRPLGGNPNNGGDSTRTLPSRASSALCTRTQGNQPSPNFALVPHI